MEPRFQLRCLGEPVLLGPDGQPVRFKVRKHLALLVYLAVESGSRHRREHLAELLWPNLPDAEGRHSLATALSMLRARFGRDVVESGRDDLRWSHTRLDLDLDRLASGKVLGDEYTTPLDVAGFLDGFEVPGAAEFMLWRERQRARWLPLVRDALVVLMDRCRRTGDSRQIEQLADRMLRLDDLSEEAVRAKMEARAFAGDRLSALKIFEAWKERLEEELGASPSPLLEGMALRLRRRGWERSGASEIPSVRTDQWKNRPFVGRANEYRTLYEGWERAQRGEAGHALVVGESGIGKSTLVERLTTAAGLEGASVARVQCYELEREIPYAAVCGLVRGLLDRPGASGTSSEALAELARTVPEVRRRYPTISSPVDSEGEAARLRLAEALQELVFAVAEEHPVILVVDDHHLADDASLAVLHLLMRRSESQAVMVILIARSSEMGRSPQAAKLKESLPRLGVATVELPALTTAESDELLTSFLPPEGPQPKGSVRRAVVNAARGFPMILELLCQDWLAHGERSLALALDAMTPDVPRTLAPTEAYHQLVERLISSLDPQTRNVLNLAAILGHRLNDIAMYALADLTVGQTMLGMSRLSDLRVLRDRGDGLEFVNELIRAHSYLNVPPAARTLLHASIADRLIARELEDPTIQGLEIAWHCVRARRSEEAVPYLLKGAQQAIRRGAPQEAERGLTTGDAILQGSDRAEALMLLAQAFQEQEDWTSSIVVLESLASSGIPIQHDRLFPLVAFAKLHASMLGPDNVQEVLQELTRIGSSSEHLNRRVNAVRVAARIVYLEKLREPTTRLIQLSSDLSDLNLSKEDRLSLHYARAILLTHVGDRSGSEAELRQASGITSDLGLANGLSQAIEIGLGAVMCAKGDYSTALQHLDVALQMGKRLGADESVALCAANSALCWGRMGHYSKQVESALKSALIIGRKYVGYRNVQIATALGYGHSLGGNIDLALRAVSDMDDLLPGNAAAWIRQGWHFAKADILTLIGKPGAGATEAVLGLTGEHRDLHSLTYAGSYARWMAVAGAKAQLEHGGEAILQLYRHLETYDAVDQVEIFAAMLLWKEKQEKRFRREVYAAGIDETLARLAARLPPPATSQLNMLGLPLGRT